MMEDIYKELKQVLESLPSPFEDEETGQQVERKFSDREEEHDGEEGKIARIEDIDVTYDEANG